MYIVISLIHLRLPRLVRGFLLLKTSKTQNKPVERFKRLREGRMVPENTAERNKGRFDAFESTFMNEVIFLRTDRVRVRSPRRPRWVQFLSVLRNFLGGIYMENSARPSRTRWGRSKIFSRFWESGFVEISCRLLRIVWANQQIVENDWKFKFYLLKIVETKILGPTNSPRSFFDKILNCLARQGA